MDLIDLLLRLRKKKFFRKISYYKFKKIGVEIPYEVSIGRNVKLVHWANGLVVHPDTIIEDNVKLYQNVTIGRADIWKDIKQSNFKGIVIRKGAIICAGAKILCKDGVLIVGKNTIVGANAVLL